MAEIRQLCGIEKPVILRLHSDLDKSLLAEIKQWVVEQAGMRTTTEGYDHDGNCKIESRNKKTQTSMRAMLLDCTGGRLMYDELAVPSMLHAVDVFNHLPEAGGLSPVEKRGQKNAT